MKNTNLILAFCSICLLLNSCGRYPCGNASSMIALVNFTDAESDTIILRRFVKNTGFMNLYDTLLITQLNGNFQSLNDTLLVMYSVNDHHVITSDYDFEIYFPEIDKIYKLTDVAEDIRYGSKAGEKVYCINPITSYKLRWRINKS